MSALDGKVTFLSAEYRPCFVGGKKALFHRWADDTRLLIKCNVTLDPSVRDRVIEELRERGVFPEGFTAEKIPFTYAIVEYEDGTVDNVAPACVRFVPAPEFRECSWEG